MDQEYTQCEDIVKSPNDPAEYSLIELSNKMRVLLISDRRVSTSASCIKVAIGSFIEPKEFGGLAHLQEHMLFLGSEKYPDPHEYNNFFTTNGGDNDASTEDEATTYMFQTSNSSFIECMDRTAAFFISPLFLEKYTYKEINAVNSEYLSSVSDEENQLDQVLADFSNPDSFYNRFSFGNKKTLTKNNIREAQLDFHKKYYSANLMHAVCLSNDSIENQRTNAVQIYSKIKNFNIEKPTYKDNPAPFGPDQKMKFIKMGGEDESDCLHMYWIQPYYPSDKDGSLCYINNLIRNKTKGSLYFKLYNDHLISECDSEYLYIADNQIQVHFDFDLTEDGYEDYMTVAGQVYQFINVLKSMEPCKRFYDEMIQTAEIEFRYLESKRSYSYVEALGDNIGLGKAEHVLYKDYYVSPFDPKLIEEQINHLNVENCFMVLVSSDHKFNKKSVKKSKEYKTKYTVNNFSDSQLETLRNPPKPEDYCYDIPCENFFIPKNFEILGQSGAASKVPVKVFENEGCVVWHNLDTVFQVPRVIVYFNIYKKSESDEISPLNEIYGQIWIQLFVQTMMHEINLAVEASVNIEQDSTELCFTQNINCYSDSLLQIIKLLKEKLAQYRNYPKDNLFKNIKETVTSEYEYEEEDAEKIGESYLLAILLKGRIPDHILARNVEKVNYEGFKRYCKEIYQNLYFESYFSGNIDKETCININHQLMDAFKTYKDYRALRFSKIKTSPVAKLQPNELYIYKRVREDSSKDDKDSVTCVYFQSPHDDQINYWKHSAMFKWLNNYLDSAFYNQLRSEEQLGYGVSSMDFEVRGRFGFIFQIKGDVKEPNDVSARIQDFLSKQKLELDVLSEKDFVEISQVIVDESCDLPLKLKKDAKLNWTEQIETHYYEFDYRKKMASELKNILKADIVDLWERMFVTQRRVLEVHIVNKEMKGIHNKAFKKRKCKHLYSIDVFHAECETYSDLYFSSQ